MMFFLILILAAMVNPVFAQSPDSSLKAAAVPIPGGDKGVRLDDMRFSKALNKVLVPAGKTGRLYLIDPVTYAMTSIDGFSSSTEDKKGHHVGVTSVDEGEGFIFTADHGSRKLEAVNEKSGRMAVEAALADDADIIRYVGINHEVWVTEPDGDKKQIEIFSFTAGDKPTLSHTISIPMPDGPESLTIDNAHQHAYTNLGKDAIAIDLKTHAITANWPNGCEKSRGTAVDEAKNFLFVACGEGKAVVLD
jgi:hypothetical protein